MIRLFATLVLSAGLIVEAAQNPAQAITLGADITPPVLSLPADITQNNDAGQCGANVPFNVTATDDSGSATVTAAPASGSFFAVGTTAVVATATDPSGNSAQGSFNVTVKDVKTAIIRGKMKTVFMRGGRFEGKRPNRKKAIVTLAKGDNIDIFDQV